MTTEKIKTKGDVTKLLACSGYSPHVNLLAKCTNTGNGYIFKFPSYSVVQQDNYICLDYCEAEYIMQIMNHLNKEEV